MTIEEKNAIEDAYQYFTGAFVNEEDLSDYEIVRQSVNGCGFEVIKSVIMGIDLILKMPDSQVEYFTIRWLDEATGWANRWFETDEEKREWLNLIRQYLVIESGVDIT